MKSTGLILLACLLLALRTMAQAPEKAAPDDLVVMAEIVGYSKSVYKGKERYMLYAKMVIRNTTDHVHDIHMMSCDWFSSWVVRRAQGGLESICITGCDTNHPTTVAIPVGEAVIFNSPLFWLNGIVSNENESSKAVSFSIGFADLMSREDVWDFATRNNDEVEMVKHAQAVYWSYNLTTEIDLATLKEIDGKQFGGYYLTNSGK